MYLNFYKRIPYMSEKRKKNTENSKLMIEIRFFSSQ